MTRRDETSPPPGPHARVGRYAVHAVIPSRDRRRHFLRHLRGCIDRYGPGTGLLRLYAGGVPPDHAATATDAVLLAELAVTAGEPDGYALPYEAYCRAALATGWPTFGRFADARGRACHQCPADRLDFPLGVMAGLGLRVSGRFYWEEDEP